MNFNCLILQQTSSRLCKMNTLPSNVITVQDADAGCIKEAGEADISVYLAGNPTSPGSKRGGYKRVQEWLNRWSVLYGGNILSAPDLHSYSWTPEKQYRAMRHSLATCNCVIALGPARYDIEITLADQLSVPIMYFNVLDLPQTGDQVTFAEKLPVYPYLSPYVTVYINSSFVNAFSHFLSNEVKLSE